jgi:hypothetical protein
MVDSVETHYEVIDKDIKGSKGI